MLQRSDSDDVQRSEADHTSTFRATKSKVKLTVTLTHAPMSTLHTRTHRRRLPGLLTHV